jgi:uncharacterized protein (TIGR03435 family)
MRAVKEIVLVIAVVATAVAQSPVRPAFEVASIRASAPTPEGQVSVGLHMDGAQVRVARLTLKDYIGIAYRIKIAQIVGPDWIASDRFDISATIPKGVKTAQIPEMFQALLEDRFQLKYHREKREFPVYALLQSKGPLKLKESPVDPNAATVEEPIEVKGGGSVQGVNIDLGGGRTFSFVPNRIEVHKMTMDLFGRYLERFADRTIVDMTGLNGQYDFTFDISPDDYLPMLIRSAINAGVTLQPQALKLAEGTTSAGLSDALQQVGLKLDARKAPLDVIVVDSASKMPTGN